MITQHYPPWLDVTQSITDMKWWEHRHMLVLILYWGSPVLQFCCTCTPVLGWLSHDMLVLPWHAPHYITEYKKIKVILFTVTQLWRSSILPVIPGYWGTAAPWAPILDLLCGNTRLLLSCHTYLIPGVSRCLDTPGHQENVLNNCQKMSWYARISGEHAQ